MIATVVIYLSNYLFFIYLFIHLFIHSIFRDCNCLALKAILPSEPLEMKLETPNIKEHIRNITCKVYTYVYYVQC